MPKALDLIEQSPNDAVTRRAALRFGLSGLGLAGVAAFGMTAMPRRAAAFTLQEADAPTMAAFHNACGNVSYHEKLVTEVRSILVARHLPADAMPQSVVCPICGCKVAV